MRTFTILSISTALALGFFFFAEKGGPDESPSLFGIPLIPPVFAQSGSPAFPDPQAGLSSYVKRDPSLIDFAKITPVLHETIDGGENYLIGLINIPRIENGGVFESHLPVSVHVD